MPHTYTHAFLQLCCACIVFFFLFFVCVQHVKAYLWRDLIVLASRARCRSFVRVCNPVSARFKTFTCYLLYFLLPYFVFIEKRKQKTFIYPTKLHYSCIIFILKFFFFWFFCTILFATKISFN